MALRGIAPWASEAVESATVAAGRQGRVARSPRLIRRILPVAAILGLVLAGGPVASPPIARAEEPDVPTLDELGLPEIAAITAGYEHYCLLGNDGSVWCWGDNAVGQLGLGAAVQGPVWPPQRVDGIPGRVREIAAFEMSTCALTESGAAWCWGANDFGILGDGTQENRSVPTLVLGLDAGATTLAHGYVSHGCAIVVDGSTLCWGDSAAYFDDDGVRPVRRSIENETLIGVTATGNSTCALTAGGAVRCWGALWQDGQERTEEGPAPNGAVVTPLGLGAGVTALTASQDSTCALVGSGEVRCWSWGWDDPALLTSLPWVPGPVPEAVPGLPDGMESVEIVRDFFVVHPEGADREGFIWACASGDGRAWCWGDNFLGQLGDGTAADRSSPVEVQTGDIAELALGSSAVVALLRDGSLVTWGNGDPAPRQLVLAPPSPATGGFREPDTLVPAITTHIPTPSDISTDPPVVGANLLLAALAMIAFTIATELLNRSLGELDPILKRRFRPIGLLDRARARLDAALIGRIAGQAHRRRADVVRILGIAAFYGIVFALLDPTWNPLSATGLWLVLIMAVAFGLVGLGGDIAAWAAARRWGIASDLEVKPGSLLTALGSTLFSRTLLVVPGVMIGSPEALEVDTGRLDRRRLGQLAGVGLGTVLAIGLVAWLATLGTTALRGGGELADDLAGGAEAFLLLVFAAAVQNGFAQLLSIRESAGLALRRAHPIPWAVALLGATFAFWHTLVNPRGDLAEALGSTNVQAFLVTVGIVLLGAVIVWVVAKATGRPAARGDGTSNRRPFEPEPGSPT